MQPPARPLLQGLTAAALAATASSFTVLGWGGLAVDPTGFTGPLVLIALGVAAAGVVLRTAGLPPLAVVLAQTLGVLGVLHASWDRGTATWGWWPNATSVGEVGATLGRAVAAAQEWAAPVPEEASAFDPLMVAIGSVVILLVDAYAVSFRRPTLAGLPLLAAFTMPVAVTGGMRWDHFALAAAAFLLLVAAQQLTAVSRWGRSLSTLPGRGPDSPAPTPSTASMLARNRGALARVLAPSLLLAVVATALVPDRTGLLGGGGAGGSGSSQVNIDNPIADLRRDLVQGPDVNLLTVRTDSPDPSYLRLSALDELADETWRPSERELPPSQRLDGRLPDPTGLSDDVRTERHEYSIAAWDELDSDWLPLPFPAVAAQAPGDWRYDSDTLDVTTTDSDLDTAGLDYEATQLRVLPTARQLVEAPAPPAQLSRDNTTLPFEDDAVPAWLAEIVDEVTAGADTDFARAVALQRWFRDPDNFTYDTDREAGNGLDDLRTFLTPGPDGRRGYCEQFAAAMAVMARVSDIPSRVAVGFLQGDQVGPGTWMFSAHDLHAWPELFFNGVGWVRFEPTPADQAPSVPGYTAGQVPQVEQSDAPTASASAPTQSRAPRAEDAADPGAADAASDGGSRWWMLPLLLVLVVLLLLVPRLLRVRQRRLRAEAVAAGGDRAAEAAWDEVRAGVVDLGHTWDDHATLHQQRRALLTLLHRAPVGSRAPGAPSPTPIDQVEAAVDVLVGSLERARFAAVALPQQEGRTLWQRAELVVGALWDRTEQRDRRRATWWPRSLRGAAVSGGSSSEAQTQVRAELEDNVRV